MNNEPLIEHSDFSSTLQDGAGEAERLGKRSPLVTFLDLSIGPTISQLVFNVYTIVNQYWISRALGEPGLQVISSMFLYDMLTFAFYNLFLISTSTHISYLCGASRFSEISQVVVDLLRFSVIIGAGFAAVIIPTTKLIVKFLTGDDGIAFKAFVYMAIQAGGSVISFFYYTICGLLEGEGRAWLFSMVQFATLVLDMLVFLPIFLFVFHWGVWSAALSGLLAQFVPLVVMWIMLMRGKLSIMIRGPQFTAKFSKETWKALNTGTASFILNFSEAFPHIYLQKFVYTVAEHNGIKDVVMSMWSTMTRLYMFSLSILAALDSGFLPPASYAYGEKKYSRIKALLFHMSWISFIWAVINAVGISLFPRQIFSLFTKDKDVLNFLPNTIWRIWATLPLYLIHEQVISYLQAVDRPHRATIVSVLTMAIPIPTISTIIYYTKKDDIHWMFNTYLFEDVGTSLIALSGAATTLWQMWRLKDGKTFQGEETKEGDAASKQLESYQSVPSSVLDIPSLMEPTTSNT
ncbi:hypothetical protein TVAG_316950 [Trichomonas vaginalis G3]|uniref:MatE family protein n=1 Tax=Trichomonas vaginalis (strain ATCC PRA-98 / G3) TaxID=412133 RepID=A2F072_TRIV3|nr:multidrug resistance protein YPNP-related family [Trichomonas vaginalis G3]EAY01707.1 hypothetical protein TVAG_316950 [Trichomonas vaginalis G3]KAI5489642.1 multidrug resistance protein YPNP-related family [Trichomonas vaginalis G3]|eukprot:XP_001330403.1 hypothetical protein [Trichomonas vaginalis G3]